MKTKIITLRFDPELIEKATIQAAGQNRKLTGYLETLIIADLKKNGVFYSILKENK